MKSVLMNFSGVFAQEGWDVFISSKEENVSLDFTGLSGCASYCDSEAQSAITKAIAPLPLNAIHWIDTGDYHYLSAIWLRKLMAPVDLLLIDNHPDNQAPAFGGDILSCGSWVLEAKANPLVKNITWFNGSGECVSGMGPEERGLAEVSLPAASSLPARSAISETGPEERGPSEATTEFGFCQSLGKNKSCGAAGLDEQQRSPSKSGMTGEGALPLYLSVDLDALSADYARTNWNQGTLTLDGLFQILSNATQGRQIAGIDICGGKTIEQGATAEDLSINLHTRMALLEYCTKF